MIDTQAQLTEPPSDERARELWLQHAVGYLIFRDIRGYAIERIDPNLGEHERKVALKSIDDTIYGLMMLIDGVPGFLRNDQLRVGLQFVAHLKRYPSGEIVEQLDLFHGDGMCMGYHGWLEGDFGDNPVVT